jgi:nitrile hydratase
MDGVHDLGGMDGYGPIHVEPDEPVFHARWEGRVYAMNTAMGARGVWNIDIGRFAIESLPPQTYVAGSYYQLWLAKLEKLLADFGLLGDRSPDRGSPFTTADVSRVLARGSYTRPAASTPRFSPGERVRARNIHPRLHTRLPRYIRGHIGIVEQVHAPNVFPDSIVRGDGEQPQWLYTVRFDGRELWGDDAEPGTEVSVDAFEPYLEPA